MQRTTELLEPIVLATLAEGAAVALFLVMVAVWCIIGATPVPA